ncbi:MAG: DNA repair protein RadA [bacterium]|nr:DNA repair protein RadA [bacterium]
MSQKSQKRYICQQCGHSTLQWLGKCPSCNAWNTFAEEVTFTSKSTVSVRTPSIPITNISSSESIRILTGIGEFDRVLGGGVVKGAVVLVGGEPGIGKSTLLLQAVNKFAQSGLKVLYVSGEESLSQIKLRATRLSVDDKKIYILSQTDVSSVINEIDELVPNIVVIDSIQTLYDSEVSAIPGSLSQVRECALKLMSVAKSRDISIFLIGHVTKEGVIAGPRTLEHMVDTVLYLEGDKNNFYRILRAAKNRFGSTFEIGIFEMKQNALSEVKDPSQMFLTDNSENPPGNVTTCIMEGSRPFLVEVQALVVPVNFRMPQRVSAGIEYKRLAMLLAIIERRLGVRVSMQDVFINVIGGLQIEETASDLAVILAVVSGVKNISVPKQLVVMGEVGLGGEVRHIPAIENRIREIERLGFKDCIIPAKHEKMTSKINLIKVRNIKDAIDETFHNNNKL